MAVKKFFKKHYSLNWLMEQAGEIPSDFEEFCIKNINDKTKWMFIERIKPKTYKTYCQHCGKSAMLRDIKAGEYTKCPVCGKKVYLRNIKNHTDIAFQDQACFIENITDDGKNVGIMVRYFRICVDYEFLTLKGFIAEELQRAFFGPKEPLRWFQSRNAWGDVRKSWGKKWINGYYRHFNVELSMYNLVYTKGMTNVLKKYEDYRYMPMERLCEKYYEDPAEIAERYKLTPQIEYLVKIGMTRLAHEIIYKMHYNAAVVNSRENNVKKFLQLNKKAYFECAVKQNVGIDGLKALQWMEINNMPPLRTYVDFIQYACISILDEIIGKVKLKTFVEYARSQKLNTRWEISNFTADYRDYINACDFLGYNTEDTMYSKPKNFKAMHDKIIALKREKHDEILNERVRKICQKETALYGFSDKKFIIRAPEDVAEIINEGKTLMHCVGGYIDRVAEERSVILFVRKTDYADIPFVTLELNPKTLSIVQYRGEKNCVPPADALMFIEKWKNKIIEPMLTARAS